MVSEDGTRPSTSRGRVSVLSSARSTASSQALLPLACTRRLPTMVPSGARRTSTSARGLPEIASGYTMFGLSIGFALGGFFCLALVFGQLLLLFLLGLLLLGQLLFALLFFLFFFFLQAFLLFLLQAVAALFFLALTFALFTLQLLLARFLLLLLAFLFAFDGDVGLPGVGWLYSAGGRRWWWSGRTCLCGLRCGRRWWGLHSSRSGLLGHGSPQFGLYRRLVGAVLPVHAPGECTDEHDMHKHRQRNGSQPCRWAGWGKLVAVVVGVHGLQSGWRLRRSRAGSGCVWLQAS